MEADDQWCLSAGPALADILGPVSNKGGIGARGRRVRHMTWLIVGKPRAAIAQWRTPYDIDSSQRVRPDPVWSGANSNGKPGVASGQTICGGRGDRAPFDSMGVEIPVSKRVSGDRALRTAPATLDNSRGGSIDNLPNVSDDWIETGA